MIYESDLNVRETEEAIEFLRQNISREIKKESRRIVSEPVKDTRAFVNMIRETVTRAQKYGLGMTLFENESEEVLELTIRIPKSKTI
jgi:ParB family chromosome partitioning protein